MGSNSQYFIFFYFHFFLNHFNVDQEGVGFNPHRPILIFSLFPFIDHPQPHFHVLLNSFYFSLSSLVWFPHFSTFIFLLIFPKIWPRDGGFHTIFSLLFNGCNVSLLINLQFNALLLRWNIVRCEFCYQALVANVNLHFTFLLL